MPFTVPFALVVLPLQVSLDWVLRKANGYFVDSSDVAGGSPFIFKVGDKRGAISCVDDGVVGMKAGGTRRLLCPIATTYVEGVEDNKPGPIPNGFGPRQQIRRVMTVRKDVPSEYLFFEVRLRRVS